MRVTPHLTRTLLALLLAACTTDFNKSDASDDAPGDTGAETDSAVDPDTEPPPGCGNGEHEVGEECDWGDENSNTTPNACREDCRLPWCGDGVVDPDYDEECEPGVPETCVTDCGSLGEMLCDPVACQQDVCRSIEICVNVCDDDEDFRIDCFDTDCNCETDCNDGVDEDDDGRPDCLDIECMLETHCPEACPPDFMEDNDTPTSASHVGPGHYPILSVCPGDDDFYSFSLGVGQTVFVAVYFAHMTGDINLMLLGPTDMEVAASESEDDNELLTYEAEMAGQHKVRLYLTPDTGIPSFGNIYDLLVIY